MYHKKFSKYKTVLIGNTLSNGLYIIDPSEHTSLSQDKNQESVAFTTKIEVENPPAQEKISSTEIIDMYTWHRRLGHINYKDLKQLPNVANGISFKVESEPLCEPCILGKTVKNPYKLSNNKAKNVLDLMPS